MPPIELPAPCHLCGQTCIGRDGGTIRRRLVRTDYAATASDATGVVDDCPWWQCPYRAPRAAAPAVIEDQTSFAVVRSRADPETNDLPPDRHARTDAPMEALSLHPGKAQASADRDALRGAARRSRSGERYDVVHVPHALIATELDAHQEAGFAFGYEHAMETGRERLFDEADADPSADVLAGALRALAGIDLALAAAVAASLRHGYDLDRPLWNALRRQHRDLALPADPSPRSAP